MADLQSLFTSVEHILEHIKEVNGATGAMEMINKSIAQYRAAVKEDSSLLEESLSKLDKKLQHSLAQAKAKKESFSGELNNNDGNDVECF